MNNTFSVSHGAANLGMSSTFVDSFNGALYSNRNRGEQHSVERSSERSTNLAFPQLVGSLMNNPFTTTATINNANGAAYSKRSNQMNSKYERIGNRLKVNRERYRK